MPGPLAVAAPAAISAIGSIAGSWMGNRAARKEAERNRRFQERMRNTQWQAAVSDMEAAGMNPALAYQQGPAASPGGSMASQEGYSGAVSSAMQAKRLNAELGIMQATKRKADADAAVAEVEKSVREEWKRFFVDRASGVVNGRSITLQPEVYRMWQAELDQAVGLARQATNKADAGDPWATFMAAIERHLPGLISRAERGGPGLPQGLRAIRYEASQMLPRFKARINSLRRRR